MSHKNISFRYFSSFVLALFVANTLAPTLQYTFAVGNQYYVDFATGSDGNAGTDPEFPWKTLARFSGSTLLPDDVVWLSCGRVWAEDMTLDQSGGPGLPLTFQAWQSPSGPSCAGKNYPKIQSIIASGKTDLNFNRIIVDAPSGVAIDLLNTSNITLNESVVQNASGSCIESLNGTGLTISGSTFSSCTSAFSGTNVEGTISYNTFSGMTDDAVSINSYGIFTINNNTFSSLSKSAIVYGLSTLATQNVITNTCESGAQDCAAIKNFVGGGTNFSASVISENIIKDIGSGIVGNNYGISLLSVSGGLISNNTVNNAEEALHIEDAQNLTISDNAFIFSRARSVQVIQNTGSSVSDNNFGANSILQKNPDYPYIEMRDEVQGGTMASMLTADLNNFYPLYKPNTSMVRAIKNGGETLEYSKSMLNLFDANAIKFEYFAYKPYSVTGSLVGANLLTNPDFTFSVSGWTPSAAVGGAPGIRFNFLGNYNGSPSATILPVAGPADRIWITNNAIFTLTGGQNYLVTGYAKSSSGNINLRGFFHKAGDMNTVYSDRIAETYASASGRVFSFYLNVTTNANDAQFSLETSNSNVDYEIDGLSIRRVSVLIKNNSATEVLAFSNTGNTTINQLCPSCFSDYRDIGGNDIVSWESSPVTINPYRTYIAMDSTSSNILNVPTCLLNLLPPYAGSVPAGQYANVSWDITNSLSQNILYNFYTGGINTIMSGSIASSGMLSYIPSGSGGDSSSIYINTMNDVGPGNCGTPAATITTNNTPPILYIESIVGTEDDLSIAGTLSGVDLNPGDIVRFSLPVTNLPEGTLVLIDDIAGTLDFYPNPEVCGTVSFQVDAVDQPFGNSASPIMQPINITCVNDAPVLTSTGLSKSASGYAAMPFNIDINEGASFDFSDVDSPYESQTFTLHFTQPANGSVTAMNTQFQYTANPAFSGSDSFQYSISDQSGGLSATGTVNLTISVFNTPPTATASGYTTSEDITLNTVLTGSDVEGSPLSFTSVTMPLSGSLTLQSNGSFSYVPNANINGSDSFTFRVYDGSVYSLPATASITITSVDDAPVALSDSYTFTGGVTTFLPVMINDSDVDSATLTLTGYTSTTINSGSVVATATGFLYTTASGYIGTDSFSYRLIDDTSLYSNTVTVNLTINTGNQPPISSNIATSTNEDNTLIDNLLGSDPNGDTLTYLTNTSGLNGTLSVTSTGVFTYVPTLNYFGTTSFTYTVSDASLTSTASTVTINVAAVNDIPVATPASYLVLGNIPGNAGHMLTGNLSGTDIEGSTLTFSTFIPPQGMFAPPDIRPTNGTFTLAASGAFTYTPALGYTGSDNFKFYVYDGSTYSAGVSVILTVQSVINNPPVATPVSLTVVGNTATNSGHILTANLTGTDVEGAVLSFSAMTNPLHGAYTLTSTGRLTYTPTLGYSGSDSFTFTVHDGGLQSASATVAISVTNNTIVITPPAPTSGPGGGGGGGGGGSYGSAPVITTISPLGQVSSTPLSNVTSQFSVLDPTGLLGQLMLTNRTLGAVRSQNMTTQATHTPSVLDNIGNIIFDEFDGSIMLRKLVHAFVAETDSRDDAVDAYSGALAKIRNIPAPKNSRIDKAKEYAIRIFERNKKIYEGIVYRNIVSNLDETFSSATLETADSGNGDLPDEEDLYASEDLEMLGGLEL